MALGPHDSWCYGTRTGRPQVIENSSATAMLGLAGMAVLAVSEGDGEVEYAIETTAAVGWCPTCGAQARLHDRVAELNSTVPIMPAPDSSPAAVMGPLAAAQVAHAGSRFRWAVDVWPDKSRRGSWVQA